MAKSTENGSGGATSLLGSQTTVNCWRCGESGCNARDDRRVAIVGEMTSVWVTRLGNLRWKHDWTSVAGQANASNPHKCTSKGVECTLEQEQP